MRLRVPFEREQDALRAEPAVPVIEEGRGLPLVHAPQPGRLEAWRIQERIKASSNSSVSLRSRLRIRSLIPFGGCGLSDVPRKKLSFTCFWKAPNEANQPWPS